MSDLKAIVAYGGKAKEFVKKEKLPSALVIPSKHFAVALISASLNKIWTNSVGKLIRSWLRARRSLK